MRGRRSRPTYATGFACLAVAGMATAALLAPPASAAPASSWTTVSSPSRGIQSSLQAVSCTSSTSCVAVGSYATGLGYDRTLVENWNGSTWTIVSSRNQGTGGNVLDGVSCTSSTRCVAVGSYISASNGLQTLAERWNGSAWSITASPNMTAGVSAFDGLNAVSCTSPTSCVAVGDYYYTATGEYQTLVESWNGLTWTIVSSPNQSNTYNLLDGVSCTSSTSCVAVGSYQPNDQTLIESWNGSTWSIVASPNQGTESDLSAVSCTSSTRCVAVGRYSYSSATQTLVESWNGSTWTVVASPDHSGYNTLSAVSCISSTSCVAVGWYYINPPSPNQTLVETWNGTAWTIVASPNKGTQSNDLNGGVSCTSSTRCVAVGWYRNATGGYHQTLIEAGPA
jgi:hypothetical protein